MKRLLLLLIFISSIKCYAQLYNVVVEYEYYREPKTSPFIIQNQSVLYAKPSESIYEINLLKKDSTQSITNDKGSYTMLNEKRNSYYYKNFNDNVLINRERILLKKFFVKDNLELFNWKILPETKIILGYSCHKAITEFRGDTYIAYYTTSIPIMNGPWKFHGLPGLILEVSSEDRSFKLTALQIELSREKMDLKNPYVKEEIIERKDFEELYTKKYYEVNKFQDDDGANYRMSKGLIEIIVKDAN